MMSKSIIMFQKIGAGLIYINHNKQNGINQQKIGLFICELLLFLFG